MHCGQEYQKLEDESRRIIEELCFYAETQVNLLPAIGRPGETSLETYLADREEHVAKLNQEVSTMSCIKERHRELKVDWELLQVTVGALLEKEEQVDETRISYPIYYLSLKMNFVTDLNCFHRILKVMTRKLRTLYVTAKNLEKNHSLIC